MAAAPAGRETPGRARLRRGRRPARAPVQKRREIAAQRRQKGADAHPSGGPQRVTVHPDIDVSGARTANRRRVVRLRPWWCPQSGLRPLSSRPAVRLGPRGTCELHLCRAVPVNSVERLAATSGKGGSSLSPEGHGNRRTPERRAAARHPFLWRECSDARTARLFRSQDLPGGVSSAGRVRPGARSSPSAAALTSGGGGHGSRTPSSSRVSAACLRTSSPVLPRFIPSRVRADYGSGSDCREQRRSGAAYSGYRNISPTSVTFRR